MQNQTILVEICAGTTCHVYGSSEMFSLDQMLSKELSQNISIEGCTCMGYCKKQSEFGKPPYARVNGHIVSQANSGKIIDLIMKLTTEE